MLAAIFEKNPLAWILAVVLAIAFYGSWQRGAELTRVCESLDWEHRLFATVSSDPVYVEKICGNRLAGSTD